MEEHTSNRRAILGILLILAGLLVVAINFHWVPWNWREYFFSWQAILIVIGALLLLSHHNRIAGLILICVGGFFLIPDIWPTSFEFRRLVWPVLLIAFGIIMITRRTGRSPIPDSDSMDYIDDMAFFGGGDKVITSQNFKGGKITAMFGGSKLNLSKANLAKGRNVIDIFAMFGGTKLIVPADWDIKIEVSAIFGGFSDKRTVISNAIKDPTKELVIKGTVIFGGGDIESY